MIAAFRVVCHFFSRLEFAMDMNSKTEIRKLKLSPF